MGCPDGRAWASNALISTTEKQSAQNLISTHKLKLNYKSLQNTFDTNSCAPEKLEPPRTSLLHEKNIRHLEIDLTNFFFFLVYLLFLSLFSFSHPRGPRALVCTNCGPITGKPARSCSLLHGDSPRRSVPAVAAYKSFFSISVWAQIF